MFDRRTTANANPQLQHHESSNKDKKEKKTNPKVYADT